MALPKLPCEYKELQRRRWKECFGDLSLEYQIKLMEIISKICDVVSV